MNFKEIINIIIGLSVLGVGYDSTIILYKTNKLSAICTALTYILCSMLIFKGTI